MSVIKRIYEKPEKSDGYRIMVDRLWPRGISKENAKIDLWLKEIAPSNELRQWFHANLDQWHEFEKRYKEELKSKQELVNQLKQIIKEKQTLTLLYSSKNTENNNAVVLLKILAEQI